MLLLSTYELGRPPLGVAMPMGALRDRGLTPTALDLAVDSLNPDTVQDAAFVAISTPMHTALRLGMAAARGVRRLNPAAHVCFHGLYAALHADRLLEEGLADSVVAGDDDAALVDQAMDPRPGIHGGPGRRLPSRGEWSGLPALSAYAQLLRPGAPPLLAAAVETTRGCKHVCRHCPVTPVWGGRFKAISLDEVLADVQAVVDAGAGHVSFADPDFLNGPSHARRVVDAVHLGWPDLSWDFTAKVDHLLAASRRGDLERFAERGAAFAITAVESFSDRVLEHLAKGHTRGQALELFEGPRPLPLRPTFVAFTPWTSRADYRDLFDVVDHCDLAPNVDPIQLAIRLLIPQGSALLDHPPTHEHLDGAFDTDALVHPWRHPDPGMDALHGEVQAAVEAATAENAPPHETYETLRALAFDAPRRAATPPARSVPRMSESWFCCAEPTSSQLTSIVSDATAARTAASACAGSPPRATTNPR